MTEPKSTTIESNNATLRENVRALEAAVRELQQVVFPPVPMPPPEWSNATPGLGEWEPIADRPGVFRDPRGIWQWAKAGHVPKSVLDRFPEHLSEPTPTINTEES